VVPKVAAAWLKKHAGATGSKKRRLSRSPTRRSERSGVKFVNSHALPLLTAAVAVEEFDLDPVVARLKATKSHSKTRDHRRRKSK
jgi:hypothetical protein